MGSGRQRMSLTPGHYQGYAHGNDHVRFVADLQQEQGKAGMWHGWAMPVRAGMAVPGLIINNSHEYSKD